LHCVALRCIASHPIPSHPIASPPCIAWRHIKSPPCIASCCIASHHLALHRLASHRVVASPCIALHRVALLPCITASHRCLASPPHIASPHCIALLRVPSPRPHFIILARTRESIKVDGTCFLVNLHLSIATSHRILLHRVASPCVALRRRIALHCIASRHIAALHHRVPSPPRIAALHRFASTRLVHIL
jgi:hypothetical protein